MTTRFFNQPYVLLAGDIKLANLDKNGKLTGPVLSEHQVGLILDQWWKSIYIYEKIGEWHEGKLL